MYALDSGPFGGVVDGVMVLLSAILSGLLSGDSAHLCGG